MKNFYISSNLEIYDVISAFADLKIIDWTDTKNLNLEVGSNVYIYVRPYYNTIAIKAKIIALNVDSKNVIDDKKYWISSDNTIKEGQKYFRLQLVEFIFGNEIEKTVRANLKNLSFRTQLTNDFIYELESKIEKRSSDPNEVFGLNYPNVVKNIKRCCFSDSKGNKFFIVLARASLKEKNTNLHICYENGILIDTSKKDGTQKKLIKQKLTELGVVFNKNETNGQLLRRLESKLKNYDIGKSKESKFSLWLKNNYVKRNGEKLQNGSINNILIHLAKFDSLPVSRKYKTKSIFELNNDELLKFAEEINNDADFNSIPVNNNKFWLKDSLSKYILFRKTTSAKTKFLTSGQEEFLDSYKKWFKLKQKDAENWKNKNLSLIDEFNEKFTIEHIKNMTIDEYVIGNQNNDGFCYWVERKIPIEAIGGNYSSYQYGIFFSKTENKFKHRNNSKYGNSDKKIFENVKKQIVELYYAAKENDINKINSIDLALGFKSKLCFIFNPDVNLPIHKNEKLNVLLSTLDIPCEFDETKENVFSKKAKIINFIKTIKNTYIDPIYFEHFVFDEDGLGYKEILESEEAEETLFNLSAVEFEDISQTTKTESKTKNLRHGKIENNPNSERKRKVTGTTGEKIVIDFLNDNKIKFDIQGEINTACEEDDYAHFDISYDTSSGKTIYIEVKSSSSDTRDNVNFIMSSAEHKFMLENIENYYIFYVNNISQKPKIYRIKAKDIIVEPSQYISTFKINN